MGSRVFLLLLALNWQSAFLLTNQRLVNMGNDTATGNGCLDQSVQLLVSTDSQLQVTGCNSLHLQVLGCVTSQLKYFSGQILQDCGGIDGRSGSNTTVAGGASLQVAMDTANGELESSTSRPKQIIKIQNMCYFS